MKKKRELTIGGLTADLAAANREVLAVMAEREHWKCQAHHIRQETLAEQAAKTANLLSIMGHLVAELGSLYGRISKEKP